jgi:hypothetical protein
LTIKSTSHTTFALFSPSPLRDRKPIRAGRRYFLRAYINLCRNRPPPESRVPAAPDGPDCIL